MDNDHNKFASLQEGKYKVLLNATDTGVFSFTLEDVLEDETDLKVFFKDVAITKGARVYANVDSARLENVQLEIDMDNDGTIDKVVEPSFIGEGNLANDTEGPNLDVEVNGAKGNDDWYTSDVEVKMTARDNEGGTGLHTIVYQQNNDSVKAYDHPLQFKDENKESYRVKAAAEDKMGNYCGLKEIGFKSDKTAPSISSKMETEYLKGSTLDLSSLIETKDQTSGVRKTKYLLNDSEVSNKLTLTDGGMQTIKVVAEDYAGNVTTYEKEISVYIPADIKINPGTKNAKGNNGQSPITAYIQLPKEYHVEDIQLNTILLNGRIVPIRVPKLGYVKNPISDEDRDGMLEYMAKI